MPASNMASPFLATLVLLLHVAVVFFLVGGFLCIVAGNRLGWRWVNVFWFRLSHLTLVLVVAGEAWLGVTCPLTAWENWLRVRAGLATQGDSFIAHWLRQLLYYEAPAWVFIAAYSGFGLLVLAAWYLLPPRPRPRRN